MACYDKAHQKWQSENTDKQAEIRTQQGKMRPTGEQVIRPIYPSSAAGSASSSSSENDHSSLSHVPDADMGGFRTNH